MNIKKRFVLFSLHSLDLNTKHDELKLLRHKGIDYKIVKGNYKGTLETSVLAIVDTDEKLGLIRQLAEDDGQESILIVNEDRAAYLEYNDGIYVGSHKLTRLECIGRFQHISALEAAELENWILDGSEYYACI